MREPHASKPTCSICGWSMVPADQSRSPGQDEFVCVNAECLEFGVHKVFAGRT